MNRWKDVLIHPSTQILKAIELIDASSLQIALVVDESNRLLGTVTDGDVRRGILKGVPLNDPVRTVMFTQPSVVRVDETRERILEVMKLKQLRQIPVIDHYGHVVGLEVWDELVSVKKRENPVVLMAGGLGSRLGPLTKECPKPLLKVGNRPVLETIIESFKEHGFHDFYITINYMGEMVKDYFGDGSRWGVNISYVHEGKRLGTAGSLGLLSVDLSLPLVVMNADLLTKINYSQLLDFHRDHEAVATMCVREYDFQVPYGVVKIDRNQLVGIEEKPVHKFFVSAGIYVLDPSVLQRIPKNEYLDMPTLFERMIDDKASTVAFPIREYWLDIGRVDDYERANGDYPEVFL